MVAAKFIDISTIDTRGPKIFIRFSLDHCEFCILFFPFFFLFLHGGLEHRMEYAARISCAKSSMYYVERYFLSRCICHCKSTHRHMSQFAYDWPPQINSLYRNRPDLRVCVN